MAIESCWVALDCTGETYSCGLLTEAGHFTEIVGLNPRRALLELPGHVGYLLRTAGFDYQRIKGVGVPLGPGSFTGVRLGITLAKTIAHSACCGVCAVDTLECLAKRHGENFQAAEGVIGVALDARRRELYCGLFSTSGRSLLPTDVRTPQAFQKELSVRSDLLALVGGGFSAYPDLVPVGFRGAVIGRRAHTALSAYTLCVMTRQAAEAGELQAPGLIAPAYHRQADIQVSG
ncbi:MAG: tRNA (adenosine(37)-N6)-threonylcarbamoyltransferase complex dimerization subunit type 1 TsaB [Vulcanimicrobiota bacterium]